MQVSISQHPFPPVAFEVSSREGLSAARMKTLSITIMNASVEGRLSPCGRTLHRLLYLEPDRHPLLYEQDLLVRGPCYTARGPTFLKSLDKIVTALLPRMLALETRFQHRKDVSKSGASVLRTYLCMGRPGVMYVAASNLVNRADYPVFSNLVRSR